MNDNGRRFYLAKVGDDGIGKLGRAHLLLALAALALAVNVCRMDP